MYKGQSNENEADEIKVSMQFIILKVTAITLHTSITLWEKTVIAFMEYVCGCLRNHDFTQVHSGPVEARPQRGRYTVLPTAERNHDCIQMHLFVRSKSMASKVFLQAFKNPPFAIGHVWRQHPLQQWQKQYDTVMMSWPTVSFSDSQHSLYRLFH